MDSAATSPGRGSGSGAIGAAAVTYVALGLGFGIGAAITLDHYAREGELPMTPFGFRSLAGVAGIWLWQGRRRGATGLATTPFALILGAGFALPFLLAGVPLRVALVLAGRRGPR